MNSVLVGAIGVAAFIAGLFFLRFWKTTRDRFFLFFALSFWIEGAHRIAIQLWLGPDEASPLAYLPRLLAYGLIIAAIIHKNRGRGRDL
jgi:hypothetical protein